MCAIAICTYIPLDCGLLIACYSSCAQALENQQIVAFQSPLPSSSMLPQIVERIRVPLHCQLDLGRRFWFPTSMPYLGPVVNLSTDPFLTEMKPRLVLEQVRRPQLMEIMEHS